MRWLLLPLKGFAFWIHRWPWSRQRRLGFFLAWIWYDVLRIRRSVVIDNILIAFPNLKGAEAEILGRRAMREFCCNLVQYSHLPFFKKRDLERFEFHGIEHIEAARTKNRGVLILTLHLGNGDLAMTGMALLGLPVHVVSKEFKSKWLNDLWFGMRARVGLRFIPPRNSSYGVLRALKANEIVIFVLDQFTGPPIGVKTRFFGRDTGTALGLAVMSERSDAAVIPAYTIRRDDGRTAVFFEPEISFAHGSDRDESRARMTQVYTDRLEQYVRMYPEQWMWLHKRWKKYKY